MRIVPCALLAMGLLCGGCAQLRGAKTTKPADEAAPPVGPVASLRKDNNALRRRVQLLEDRVLKLEMRGGVAMPSDLPVVKLHHQAQSSGPLPPSAPQPAARSEAYVSPSRARALPSAKPEPQPDARWDDSHGFAGIPGEPDGVADPKPRDKDGRSYRLVGSHLVEMTKSKAPKRPDRPARGRRGSAIRAEYDAAMGLYRSGEVVQAEAAFSSFATTHPKHDYADNALYWQGEAAYDQKHYADALATFTAVVERYGGGNKAPDALLKIGLCYHNVGDTANARDVLSSLIAAYPGARASDIARARLAELEM